MSLDRISIDKEIERLGVEALMFWELPKVDIALTKLCQKWFFNDSGAHLKGPVDIYDDRHYTQVVDSSHEPTTVIDLTGEYPVIIREGKGDPEPFR